MSVSAWHHVDFKKQPGAKRLHAYMVGSSLVSRLTSIGCVATADTLPAAAPHPQFSQNERTSPSNLPPALFPTLPLALPLSPPLVLELPGLACCSSWCFVLCLGFYVTPALLGGGKAIMVAMKISDNIELYYSWGAASALGVVLLIVTVIILYIASKLVPIDQVGNRS